MSGGQKRPYLVGLIDLFGLLLAGLLVGVNAGLQVLDSWPAGLLIALAIALYVTQAYRRSPWQSPALDSRELTFVGVAAIVVGCYCLSWYWLRVPYDFWLDYPQQALLYRWGLPSTHPYLSEVFTQGQYGRNLWVAALARGTGASVLTASIISNVLFQMLALCQLYLVQRKQSVGAAVYTVLLVFLGLGVGGWSGLLDHFFHHAAAAHLLLFLGWRAWQNRSALLVWPLLALGLVFPLYLVLLLPGWLMFSDRWKRDLALAGLLLLLCVFQGGPLQQLLSRTSVEQAETASQSQRFSLRFPKAELFQIYLQPWAYWRVSSGLTSTVAGHLKHHHFPRQYASIVSLEVLQLHWFPLWLAPLTLLFLPRETRPWWVLGLLAYLTPALVDFGPVYESEYYRWQLAAALGFGVCLASVLARHRLGVLLVVVCCLPGLNRLATHDWQFGWPQASAWLRHHTDELRLRPGELELCERLRHRASEGDQIWRDNLPDIDDQKAILSDAVVVGLTGLKVTGHAFPNAADFIGRPPFRPSLNARAFWLGKEAESARQAGVRWLLCHQSRDLSSLATRVLQQGEVVLWEVALDRPLGSTSREGHGTTPTHLRVFVNDVFLYREWCPEFSSPLRMSWTRIDGSYRSQPIYQSSRQGLLLSTPVLAGNYLLELSSGQTLKVEVLPTASLSDLRADPTSKDGAMAVWLENQADGELRLHDVRFTLLLGSGEGSGFRPGGHHFQEVFVIKPGGRVRVPLSVTGSPEQLNIEAREGSRMVGFP